MNQLDAEYYTNNQTTHLTYQLQTILAKHPVQVGIFWLVNGELVVVQEWLTCAQKNQKVSSNYDMYDDMYTIDHIHCDVWEALRAENKLPEHITAEQDFGDYPRGRILFDPQTQSHCVYSAVWLVSHVPFQNLITKHYRLISPRFVANEQYEIDEDDHLAYLQ